MPHSDQSFEAEATPDRMVFFNRSRAASGKRIGRAAGFLFILACLFALSVPTHTQAQLAPVMQPAVQGTTPYLNTEGWTVFTPSADTRIIYVSNSQGNDSNDGLSASTPVKTINKGLSLIRHTYPDWLLFKKGDVWTDESFGYISGVNNGTARSGRSASEPMLFSSYGSGARPLIKTNPAIHNSGIGTAGGGGGGGGDYLAMVGLEFYAYTRDPNSTGFNAGTITNEHFGATILNPINWMLFEDCKFSFYQNIAIQPAGSNNNLFWRRNIVTDSYSTNSHSQGMYVENLANLVLEENVFDHNGWNESIPGAMPTIFNHNIYLQGNQGPARFVGNIVARGSANGIQMRSGGTASDNLLLANSIALLMAGPYAGDVKRNVIIEGVRTNWGIDSVDNANPFAVADNIIANSASGSSTGVAIRLQSTAHDVTATNNVIYNIEGGTAVANVGANNTTTPNEINRTGYPEPTRSVGSYNATLGGNATQVAFLTAARLQSKDNWRPQYTATAVNAYIRAGFGTASSPTPPPPPPPPSPTLDTIPPSSPIGLTATAGAQLINLSWTTSTDNVGVAGYKIFRNGTPIGTTATTSYQDADIVAGTTYSYAVSAYDAAGNTSSPSTSVSAAISESLEVAITAPTDGATIKSKGNIDVNVAASTSASITVTVDGKLLGTCSNARSCTVQWRRNDSTQGTHTIATTATTPMGGTKGKSITVLTLR